VTDRAPTPADSLPRIASLLASGTEIVCALGLGDQLVGVSHECDYPPRVRGLPVLTAPRLDARAPSAEIDRRVRERAAAGLSLYEIFTNRLRDAAPDLIVTQDQCRVCAVSLEQVQEEVQGMLGRDVRVVSLSPHTLEDALDDVVRVAEAAGVAERGRALRRDLRSRLERLASRANCASGHRERRPSVLCLEWLDPPFLSGLWMPALVAAAGADIAGPETRGRSPAVDWKTVVAAQPDVLLLMPCGFDLARTLEEAPAVLARPEVRATPAFRNGQVWALDGNAYFNRSGPRLVESAEILAAILYSDVLGPPDPAAARRLGGDPGLPIASDGTRDC
jgi:iron complex transport system substrate-binding protein